MERAKALPIAMAAWRELKPWCIDAKIAGSLRREKAVVKDIELVVMPRMIEREEESPDLFDTNPVKVVERVAEFGSTVRSLGAIAKGNPETGRMVQVLTPAGIMIDLFIARPENWGYILTIRTGSWQFGKALFTRARQLGYNGDDGMLRNNGRPVDIREEAEYFRLLRMRMPEPKNRELGTNGLKPWIIV